jgi:hypothetical protein
MRWWNPRRPKHGGYSGSTDAEQVPPPARIPSGYIRGVVPCVEMRVISVPYPVDAAHPPTDFDG